MTWKGENFFKYFCSTAFFQTLPIIGMGFLELFQIATCLCLIHKSNHQYVNAKKLKQLTNKTKTPHPPSEMLIILEMVELKVLESLNLTDEFISVLKVESELALLQMPFAPEGISGRTLVVFKLCLVANPY